MNYDNIIDIATYLRAHAAELGSRILETYPPLQSTKDPIAPAVASLLRKALPAQGLAITGTAKYLRRAKAARIVAECGAGKTYMALGTIHVLAGGRPSTTLVMCPSHITHKWAREVLLTIPRARAFLIEDMRNGGDPSRPHGICEVKLSKGKTVYEGKRLSLAEMRRMGRKEWRKRFPGPTFFITGKDKGKLGYFWEHVYIKAKSGPNLGGVVNPDSGVAILDSEMQKLTALDFTDKLKVSEALTAPRGGTTRFSALWQADRSRIQRMAPIEYIGRYVRGWFDFAIADELHQLAGDGARQRAWRARTRSAEIDRPYWDSDGRLRKVHHGLPFPLDGTRCLSGKQLSLFGQDNGENSAGIEMTPGPVDDSQFLYDNSDAPPCVVCGGLMKPSGTCYTCINCGQTSGCS